MAEPTLVEEIQKLINCGVDPTEAAKIVGDERKRRAQAQGNYLLLINFLQGEWDAELYFARQQESNPVLSGNYIFDSINLLIDN